jgi:2-dehydro-3-deoxygalactonokinase
MIISCDWGTSSFRLRLVDADGRVLRSFSGAKGIADTFNEWQQTGMPPSSRVGFYQAVLQTAIEQLGGDLHGVPVVLSGMASSSIGMLELPYHELPFWVSGEDLQPFSLPSSATFPHTLLLVPGVRSENDVMRGEETQLIGCDSDDNGHRLFIFPGTHSKHISVFSGLANGLRTYMTGEFFSLLSRQSILAASIEDSGSNRGPAFFAGVDAGQHSDLLHSAFSVRTNQLFAKWSKADNYQYLSGLLIGAELKGLRIQPVALVAVEPLLGNYRIALRRREFKDVVLIDADQALVRGHRRLFERYAGAIENP